MFAVLADCPAPAQQQADAPPTEPILRLNTTAHTARLWRIATDRENRYAVTASDDKTARVWSLADGRLLSVLRVPIGEGEAGSLRAVAMTPDGTMLALGGWTGMVGGDHNIYISDPMSGVLKGRLSGLPYTVYHLAYSFDGRLLAAALASTGGIRVYDASRGYEPVPSDTDYGDYCYWVDFDRQGRLVTTSYDGFIRLYAPGRYDFPIAKVKGRGGSEPYSAVFSPDGKP
jgi:WD40 repeat protein